MSPLRRTAPLAALLVALGAWPGAAQARIPVCVQLIGPTLPHRAEYQRLLGLELRHHPTHRLVSSGCRTRLVLEYVQLAAGGLLTGRIQGGIPHRVPVARLADLPKAIREMVRFLLKREPVFLVEHLDTSGLLSRPKLSLRRDGVNLYGLEATELFLIINRHVTMMPSLSFRFRRAVDRWFLGALAAVAVNPRSLPHDPTTGAPSLSRPLVRLSISARMETGYYISPESSWSLYVSGLLGVSISHVYDYNEALGGVDDLVGALGEISARFGVEGFRMYAVRVGCHAQVNLPLHKYPDPDYNRVNAWTPSFEVGCGLAF